MYKKVKLFSSESKTKPLIGDWCINDIKTVFRWTNTHEEQDVINTLVEYRNIKVIHFHIKCIGTIEKGDIIVNNLDNIIGESFSDIPLRGDETALPGEYSKLLASTNKSYNLPMINNEFIEKIIVDYMDDFECGVQLEYETMYKNQKYGLQPFPDETCKGHESMVKVINGEVFIKLIKENFSRERVIELLNQLASDYVYFYDGLDENNKVKTSWLDENLDN